MLICLVASAAVIFIKDWYPLAMLGAASFVYAAAHNRFRVLLVAYAAVSFMMLTALGCVYVILIFMPEMGAMGLGPFLNPFLRVVILIHVVLALALSSRVKELLSTLKALRLPLFIYLPATVMIRFIPSFINDVRLIRESLKIKGYAVNPLTLTLRPALTLRLLFAPIVVRALRSSDELAVAAEIKGIGYADRMTFIKQNRFRPADYIACATTVILAAAAL
jgi:energy-coupling factor transport system permease protein